MKALFIPPKNHSPRVEFYPNGHFLLEGRSFPEDAFKLYDPIIEYAKNVKIKRVQFDINLEYFNSASCKKILQLMRTLDDNPKIEVLDIVWHYQKDDNDSLEMAEIFEGCLHRSNFYFTEYNTIKSRSEKTVSFSETALKHPIIPNPEIHLGSPFI